MDNEHKNGNRNGKSRPIDKLIKIGQAELLMREMMSPVPSRPTLISQIKKGNLKGRLIFNSYYIYESSLQEFIEKYKETL